MENLDNIPEFTEPRFFVERGGTHRWWIKYREGGRKLALCGWGDETVTRSRCQILNELFDAAAAHPPASDHGLIERIAVFVEHLRDEYLSEAAPVKKVARYIREEFGSEAFPASAPLGPDQEPPQ